MLGTAGGVFIQKSQMGGGSPMIRGFAANRILIVVDGVRMNNAIYRSGNLQNVISIDANSIENSEIIFGPGSVIYGSDAIGGVTDFHTLKPRFAYDSVINFSANVLTRYSSANNEKTGHIDFNIGLKKWAFVSNLTYTDYDDLKMGNNGHEDYSRPEYVDFIDGKDSIVQNKDARTQKFSAYNQINFLQKIEFRPNLNWKIKYAFHFSELSDVPRYDRLIQYSDDILKYGDWYYGPQKWIMNVLDIRFTKSNKLFDNVKFISAFQNYEESRHDRKLNNDEIRERTEKVNIFSANLDFEKQLQKNNSVFYGIESVTNKIFSTGQSRNIFTDFFKKRG